MVIILSPPDIKKKELQSVKETRERINKLGIEENRIVNQLNVTRDQSKIQKKEIEEELQKFREEQRVTVKTLYEEVSFLEDRKKEALKPIKELKKKIDEGLVDLKIKENDIKNRNKSIDNVIKENEDISNKLKLRKEQIDKDETIFDERNRIIRGEENRIKTDDLRLVKDVKKFNDEMVDKLKILLEKENEVKSQTKINEINRKRQEKRDTEQDNRNRAINDKYATFERTVKRMENKYKTK